MRTANSDTPACAATAACDMPAADSARISAVSSGVSLDGPFGPRLPGISAATPPACSAFFHCHTVDGSASHAAATSFTFAAARPDQLQRRRQPPSPASSPGSQQNVSIPCTHTAPDP